MPVILLLWVFFFLYVDIDVRSGFGGLLPCFFCLGKVCQVWMEGVRSPNRVVLCIVGSNVFVICGIIMGVKWS